MTPDKSTLIFRVCLCHPLKKKHLSYFSSVQYLMRISGINILRVYGNVIQEEEFPIPNQVKQTRQTEVYEVTQNLKHVALHHVITDKEKSPFARQLKKFENKFARVKKAKKKVDDNEVKEYLKV